MKKELTQQQLRSLVRYDSSTGELFWKVDKGRARVGASVGCLSDKKYLVTSINRKGYRVSRLVWFYVYGEWPDCVDHIDHNRTNNRIENLRSVQNAQNCKNRSYKGGHGTIALGVRRDKSGKYSARIGKNGKCYHIGTFETKEEALEKREKAERELGYHKNHGH